MSNGGSMAFRFNCERADLIAGLAIQSQVGTACGARPERGPAGVAVWASRGGGGGCVSGSHGVGVRVPGGR